MARESIRYFSITVDYDIWLLSDKEVQFYNTIYAFVAIIMGLGSAISFIIDKPLYLRRSATIKTSILNDQRVLSWVFIAWASKLGFVFGFLFCGTEAFYEFSLYPDYNFMFILFVIVLYMQLWVSISRFIKFKTLTVILTFGIIISILSFLLGSINLIDYKSINNTILKKNIYHNFKLNKPKSKSWTIAGKASLTLQLFLVYPKTQSALSPPNLVFDNKIIDPTELGRLINKWKTMIPQNQHSSMHVLLNIDKSTKMKYVNTLKRDLLEIGIFNIGYAVIPEGAEGDKRRFSRFVIPAKLPFYKMENFKDGFKNELDSKQIINLQLKGNRIYINNKSADSLDLKKNLKEEILKNTNYRFSLNYSENDEYNNFIELYSIIRESILEIRNEHSITNYGVEYNLAGLKINREIKYKYPLSILDNFNIEKTDAEIK